MKGLFFFSTKLRMFISEIPIIILLALAIRYNPMVQTPMKLYPLIIACIAGIIFIIIYLFRAIVISNEEVRSIGLFSSRDRSIINRDKTLVLTLRPRHKIKVELFGIDDAPGLDWIDKEDVEKRYTNIYRDITVGGTRAVRRTLVYFGLSSEEIDELISKEKMHIENDDIRVRKEKTEHGDTYSIYFKKTL